MQELDTTPEEHERGCIAKTVRGLIWIYPEERFAAFSEGRMTFGRDPTCTVRLDGQHVSRVHATVRREGGLPVLRDEGSRNGTRRNGEVVEEAPLCDDDVVRVGEWVGVVARIPAVAVQSKTLFDEPAPGVLIGPRTQALWDRVCILAASRVPVLLTGPTGCGKEVFARAIHTASGRAGAFVAQNCAALPESLAEAQLFGHVRGAFTGASAAAPGIFEAADGGTLFLDEIADLPLAQQAKLLRVTEERAVVPLGAVTPRPVDVRLVAACHAPLAEYVATGRFRGDLLARLAGATIEIPALAARREEVPRLFKRFFEAAGGDPERLQASLVERLCTLDWAFNVRQLKHVAEGMLAFQPTGPLDIGYLEETLRQSRGVSVTPPAQVGARHTPTERTPDESLRLLGHRRSSWFERNHQRASTLKDAVGRHDGNVSSAARELGISRQRAQRLLAALDEVERKQR